MNKPILEGLAEALAYNLTNTRTEIKTKMQIKRKERALMCVCVCVSSFFAKHSLVLKRSETLTAMLQPCSCTIAGKVYFWKYCRLLSLTCALLLYRSCSYPYLITFFYIRLPGTPVSFFSLCTAKQCQEEFHASEPEFGKFQTFCRAKHSGFASTFQETTKMITYMYTLYWQTTQHLLTFFFFVGLKCANGGYDCNLHLDPYPGSRF